MTDYIQISKINDFIFCPYSLYLHSIYDGFSSSTYHSTYQIRGKIRHDNIDNAMYSSSKRYLQGTPVYSSKYGLAGKIDIFDIEEKALIERKYKLNKIYDGHKYQLFAQYFCMLEKGYEVEKLFIHSLSDNKRYKIDLPSDKDLLNFESTIDKMTDYILNKDTIEQMNISTEKCKNCIYNNLCTYKNVESK